MADVTETTQYEDAAHAVSQGKRHLLVRDYYMAVTALAQGCSMLAAQHGDLSDELGEPYLLYGRALLCLAREEAGVLGTGVPGTEEAEEEDAEEEADGEAEEDDGEEEADEKEKEEKDDVSNESKADDKADNDKVDNDTADNDKPDSKNADNDKSEDKKEKEQTSTAEASSSSSKNEASSKDTSKLMNGEATTSTTHQNGDAHEDEDSEDVENEDEDGSNLQLAWEVLELAKLIISKRGESAWKLLAEAHRLLGEVAMESGNQPGALTDLNACLDLLRRIEPADPRSMAETHYQLGLAHSLGNEFDSSIEQFNEAVSLLETRIKDLQSGTEQIVNEDPFYTVESEIKELQELLPEIREKISDMRDFKHQACKLVIEGIKNKVAGGSCSNGAGPSGESSSNGCGSSSSSTPNAPKEIKPASDITHLIRKKRKIEEDECDNADLPSKKPTPEKCA